MAIKSEFFDALKANGRSRSKNSIKPIFIIGHIGPHSLCSFTHTYQRLLGTTEQWKTDGDKSMILKWFVNTGTHQAKRTRVKYWFYFRRARVFGVAELIAIIQLKSICETSAESNQLMHILLRTFGRKFLPAHNLISNSFLVQRSS